MVWDSLPCDVQAAKQDNIIARKPQFKKKEDNIIAQLPESNKQKKKKTCLSYFWIIPWSFVRPQAPSFVSTCACASKEIWKLTASTVVIDNVSVVTKT